VVFERLVAIALHRITKQCAVNRNMSQPLSHETHRKLVPKIPQVRG